MNKKNLFRSVLATAIFSLSLPLAFGMEEPAATPGVEELEIITMQALVTAVDLETRQVTLADELGKEVTITVGDMVERLNEVAVGDVVEVDYYLSLAAEFRAPTADELASPLQIEEDLERSDMTEAPAGGAYRMITAVCVVEGLDRPTETVTLMGPLGGLNVVQVKDVGNLTKMRIGDTIVVTFTEAVIIALETMED